MTLFENLKEISARFLLLKLDEDLRRVLKIEINREVNNYFPSVSLEVAFDWHEPTRVMLVWYGPDEFVLSDDTVIKMLETKIDD